MGNELRNPIPLRRKAGGKHKLIPSNFKQIYEGRVHPSREDHHASKAAESKRILAV